MKKILFPTEFADHAPQVFRYAVEIAHHFNARLVMMYAYGNQDVELEEEEVMEHQVDMVTDLMVDFVEKNLPDGYGETLKISYIAQRGNPAEAILEVALERNIDLIVMGMTGKKNALDVSFGTTTQSVFAKADCQVLLIPPTAEYKGIDNIVFTTNFEFRDLEGINYLRKWSKAFEASIHCLHIIENREYGLKAIKNISILKKTYKGRENYYFDMLYGDFRGDIERLAAEKNADIITMMMHKRNLVTSLVDRSAVNGIAHRLNTPLLIVKDNAYELDESTERWLKIVHSVG